MLLGYTFIWIMLRSRALVVRTNNVWTAGSSRIVVSRLFSSQDSEESHRLFREQMEELKREREELFGFTEEDRQAWSKAGLDHQHPASLMEEIEQARSAASNPPPTLSNSPKLSHISDEGASVRMVDIGEKEATARVAVARTEVLLPPEVLEAFTLSELGAGTTELVGVKGPIFETARIAGIMAAKKTSDLIPLCHPLPLEKVQINIHMRDDNTVVIECECRLTHKTGVEMEALTGASVAALVIYDMTKAVSHNIVIRETRLLSKHGGKRTVVDGVNES